MLNIDTLVMTLFDIHCKCTTSFGGSTVYFIVTRIKKCFPKIYVHEYVGDADVSNQILCNMCGMAQFLTFINLR